MAYLGNPGVESRDPSEHGRFAVVVAAKRGTKTDDAMDLPFAISLAVERTTRVPL